MALPSQPGTTAHSSVPPSCMGRTDENIKTYKALRHCVKRQHYKNLNAAGKLNFVTFKLLSNIQTSPNYIKEGKTS